MSILYKDIGLKRLSRIMTAAYLLATVLLIAALAFSYFSLRTVLVEESRLNALAATTSELRLAIRESAIHVGELKTTKKTKLQPESRLDHKIRIQLSEVLSRIDALREQTRLQVAKLTNSEFHAEFERTFVKGPNHLWDQLDNYTARLRNLTAAGTEMPLDSSGIWLPVEATAAQNGALSIGYQTALTRIRELVNANSKLLESRHRHLSVLSMLLLLLEAFLIFLPLSRMLRNAHQKMQQAHDELFLQANFDAITRLPNTTGIARQLPETMSSAQDTGLIVVRLQNIDDINNIVGPGAMSDFFLEFSSVLIRSFPENSLLFRSGDTEFAAIVAHYSDRNKNQIATTLQHQMTNKLIVGNAVVYPRISMGADSGSISPADINDKLVNARLAQQLYKTSEATIPSYQTSMRQLIDTENLMVDKIREGLKRREFVPFYQLKVDATTGLPCAMEALCRWRQPDGTLVSPAHFIPVAEHSGLISQLTWQLLEQIAEDWQLWISAGLNPGRIAFNAAQTFLLEPDFATRLQQIIESIGAEDCPLDLEVTENIAVTQEQESISSALDAARALGLRIALDDFGTGYASLSSLATLDIDTIKIDRSFVQKMETDDTSRNVVTAIINLCTMLDFHSVVEGVETEQQWKLCRLAGCDEIQGYYFYKPAPYEEVTCYLSQAQQERKAG